MRITKDYIASILNKQEMKYPQRFLQMNKEMKKLFFMSRFEIIVIAEQVGCCH